MTYLHCFVHQLWISMLIAFYVTLVEKTLQGSGLGWACRPVSKDGTVTVMKKDPNVQVDCCAECAHERPVVTACGR